MNQSVKIAICFILFAVISVIIYFLIKIRKQSNKNRDKFISYLESKNDYVNLIKFGFYNTSGFRENRRVPFLDNIILDEYKLNNDHLFLEYLQCIRHDSRNMILLSFLAFLLFCCMTAIVNVS